MRHVLALTLLMGLSALPASARILNEDVTLVLHAVQTDFGFCPIPDPCPDATVEVSPGMSHAIYLIVRNHDEVAGVQTAFEWDASWFFLFGIWDCQTNQVSGVEPGPPGGGTAGTIATAFDCVTGGAGAVIGRLHVVPITGCMMQVDSTYPFGTHVVSCSGEIREVELDCRGIVCVAPGGINACEPCASVAVEPTTWGGIKLQFE